jgi:hypothetical protein
MSETPSESGGVSLARGHRRERLVSLLPGVSADAGGVQLPPGRSLSPRCSARWSVRPGLQGGDDLGPFPGPLQYQSGARRVLSRQNSLPSGSARTCHCSSPVWPMSAGRAPSLRRRSSSES